MTTPHEPDPTRPRRTTDAAADRRAEIDQPTTPRLTRDGFLRIAWASALGLPVLVFLTRLLCGYSGWITVFYAITYGPILLAVGLVPAGLAHLLPRGPDEPRGLRGIVAAFTVWAGGNVLGVGVVLSDLDDMKSHPSPLESVIPYAHEWTVALGCLAVAYLALLVTVVLIIRARIAAA